MNDNDERRNRDICCAHDLGTTISKIYFIFAEEEAALILRNIQNIQELRDECWRRWEIMCANDEQRYQRMLEIVRTYEELHQPNLNPPLLERIDIDNLLQ